MRRIRPARERYEVIWLEFYEHMPAALDRMLQIEAEQGRVLIDQRVVCGFPGESLYNKHYLYNLGIALARGEIVAICDSDAIYPRDFVEKVLAAFETMDDMVLHADQVRSSNKKYYPFNYPHIETLLSDSLTINWAGRTTSGLASVHDFLHTVNYGAFMAARRRDVVAIGGADEHPDYTGYICGPYEMTFRLVNKGHNEVWLTDVVTYHTWHPSEGGVNNVGGPHDGRGMSSRALEAIRARRVMPFVMNPVIAKLLNGETLSREDILQRFSEVDPRQWRADAENLQTVSPPQLILEGLGACNIVLFRGIHYAVPQGWGAFIPEKLGTAEYAHLASDASLPVLLQRLQPEPIQAAAPAPVFDACEIEDSLTLIRQGVFYYNILRYRGQYYGVPQSHGRVSVEDLVTTMHPSILVRDTEQATVYAIMMRAMMARMKNPTRHMRRLFRGLQSRLQSRQ